MTLPTLPARGSALLPGTPDRRRRSRATVTAALSGLALFGMALVAPVSPATAGSPPGSFADLAEKVTPAVVNISTTVKREMPQGMPFDFPEGSPFEEFFKQFQDRFGQLNPDQRQMPVPEGHALGSGFVIDPKGYIVTNNHVVEQATEIQVTFTDGTQLPAKVVGRDQQTDLALLKVESDKNLPSVEFGNSDRSRVGDWVIAVGNPFGLGGTVSAGIISARGRDIHAGPFDDFLQLDAAINPGNSGGPTFAMDGKVVGVNTAIASPNGGNVGIGFAIPANLAKPIIDQLKTNGAVERGWLGVQIQDVTPELAEALGLGEPRGALVSGVMPDGPAAAAGVRQGDVIVAFDGKPVQEMRDLPRIVAETPAGKDVKIEVWRDGSTKTLHAEIAKQKSKEEVATAEPTAPSPGSAGTEVPALGATVAPATPDLQQRFGLPGNASGVVIVDLAPDGPAAKQGLMPGDVIEQVSQRPVKTPADVERLAEAARQSDQKSLLLLVNRQGDNLYVALKLAEV